MRLFISHAVSDLEVAEALMLRLQEISGVHCRLLGSDIAPGDDWELRIREAARECDAIACLVTPEYIKRPWFYAEWAAFWFQEDKTWYLLMLETSLDEVFEVMRRRQSTFLNDRRSVERLLQSLATGDSSPRGTDLLADEIVRAVSAARARCARVSAEVDLARLSTRLRSGQDNVDGDLVDRLLKAGRSSDIVVLARLPASDGPTKRRQLAVQLVARGQASVAARFDELIFNNAERRTVGIACLNRRAQVPDVDADQLLWKIYAAVRDPQRRDLRDHASALGLTVPWPPLKENP